MNNIKIPISKPFFGKEEEQAILEPIRSGWVVQGPQVARFEKKFSVYTGSKYAIAVTSGTTAIHLALLSIGVGEGDEVIIPSYTWVATANMVELCGARPVFVDIDLSTFNIDPRKIENAISPSTKSVLPVSLFGLSAEMRAILKIADDHHIAVIEDDACALGAFYHGIHAGRLARAGCFSFHPRKAITTGEGGMIITDDEHIARMVRSLRDHGVSLQEKDYQQTDFNFLLPDFCYLGFNYRMTDIQGAIGNAQMGRLNWILQNRARVANRYDEQLRGLNWLKIPHRPENYVHGFQSYVCLYEPEAPTLDNIFDLNQKRNLLMKSLQENGIATRPGTHAVHMLSYYQKKYGIKPADYFNAFIADQLSFALPIYPQMSEPEQDYVIETLINYK